MLILGGETCALICLTLLIPKCLDMFYINSPLKKKMRLWKLKWSEGHQSEVIIETPEDLSCVIQNCECVGGLEEKQCFFENTCAFHLSSNHKHTVCFPTNSRSFSENINIDRWRRHEPLSKMVVDYSQGNIFLLQLSDLFIKHQEHFVFLIWKIENCL